MTLHLRPAGSLEVHAGYILVRRGEHTVRVELALGELSVLAACEVLSATARRHFPAGSRCGSGRYRDGVLTIAVHAPVSTPSTIAEAVSAYADGVAA